MSRTALALVVLGSALWLWQPVRGQNKPATEPDKDAAGQLVKLDAKAISLGNALKEVAKQTGIAVEDRRRDKEDRKLKLNLDKATFWQALDAIAREADLQVYLHDRDRKVVLVDGPYRELPTSYHGPFRITLKKLATVRDLELDAHYCVATLEIAWEPRFLVFLMEPQTDSLVVKDDKGQDREVPRNGKARIPVNGHIAAEFPVRFSAPARSANALSLVQGKLSMIGSPKMLKFTFADPKAGQKQTQEGVTVILDRFSVDNKELWTVGLSLKYPPGPQFESFESSLVNNEIFLEHKQKRTLVPCNAGSSVDQSDNEATARYHFEDNPLRKQVLGKPADWRVVYFTPGKIVELPVPFEFKDVPLP